MMKRGIWYFLLVMGLLSIRTSAQTQGETIKKMLQGLWALSANDSITLAFSGDTILECNTGTHEMDLLSYTLSTKPCDSEVLLKSPSGYYISIFGSNEEDDEGDKDELCGAIKFINSKEFKLLLDDQRMAIFEKLQ